MGCRCGYYLEVTDGPKRYIPLEGVRGWKTRILVGIQHTVIFEWELGNCDYMELQCCGACPECEVQCSHSWVDMLHRCCLRLADSFPRQKLQDIKPALNA